MPSPPFDPGTFQAERGLFSSLLGGASRQRALVELNDRLCASRDVRELPIDLLDQLNSQHGVDLRNRCASDLQELYRRAAGFYLRRPDSPEDDRARLGHLRVALSVKSQDAATIHREIGTEELRSVVKDILKDERVTPEERRRI